MTSVRPSDAPPLPDAAPLPLDAQRILIVLPSWVGDVCMATPLLRHIATCRPNCRIVAFGRPSLAPLMDGLPWIESFEGGAMRGITAMSEIARMRKRKFDAVLLLPNSFRSALFARWSGIRHRGGVARDGRSWMLTHPFMCDRPSRAIDCVKSIQSATTSYAALAQWWTGEPLANHRVELRVTDAERALAQALLRDSPRPGGVDRRDLVLLNPGANREDKRWSAAHFSHAARLLSNARPRNEPPRPIAITGGPSERELCAEIAKNCDAIDLCGRGVTLGSLKGVMERTALLVTNDTGPRHIAAALETPTIALFGPTDCRWTPLNYPRERRVVAEPFLTEDRIADDHARVCAIDRICVGDVVHAARSIDPSFIEFDGTRISP